MSKGWWCLVLEMIVIWLINGIFWIVFIIIEWLRWFVSDKGIIVMLNLVCVIVIVVFNCGVVYDCVILILVVLNVVLILLYRAGLIFCGNINIFLWLSWMSWIFFIFVNVCIVGIIVINGLLNNIFCCSVLLV